jgi:hypothetical protein
MNGMSPERSHDAGREQVIGALLPPARPSADLERAAVPALPHHSPAGVAAVDGGALDVARLDRSGRVSARRLLRLLGWRPGHRISIRATSRFILLTSSVGGELAAGQRGELPLPSAARHWCGLRDGEAAVLLAVPLEQILVVYPQSLVAGLLSALHATEQDDADGR